jgi:hypothetical protein
MRPSPAFNPFKGVSLKGSPFSSRVPSTKLQENPALDGLLKSISLAGLNGGDDAPFMGKGVGMPRVGSNSSLSNLPGRMPRVGSNSSLSNLQGRMPRVSLSSSLRPAGIIS